MQQPGHPSDPLCRGHQGADRRQCAERVDVTEHASVENHRRIESVRERGTLAGGRTCDTTDRRKNQHR